MNILRFIKRRFSKIIFTIIVVVIILIIMSSIRRSNSTDDDDDDVINNNNNNNNNKNNNNNNNNNNNYYNIYNNNGGGGDGDQNKVDFNRRNDENLGNGEKDLLENYILRDVFAGFNEKKMRNDEDDINVINNNNYHHPNIINNNNIIDNNNNKISSSKNNNNNINNDINHDLSDANGINDGVESEIAQREIYNTAILKDNINNNNINNNNNNNNNNNINIQNINNSNNDNSPNSKIIPHNRSNTSNINNNDIKKIVKSLLNQSYNKTLNYINPKYLVNEEISLNTFENILRYRQARFENYKKYSNNVSNVSSYKSSNSSHSSNSNSMLGEWGDFAYLKNVPWKAIDEIIKVEKFNKPLSDVISLDRRLPDYRIKECSFLTYPEDLPQASVIIVFCNEAPSVILRTAHSVVNRSPPRYLAEVILVDDFSDREDLHVIKPHLQQVYPDGIVKLLRADERLGLIGARNFGAKNAVGDVVVFLDAHCEVTTQWLEPLLSRIKENRKTVVCPLIDMLCSHTFHYSMNGGGAIGGFKWDMAFDWMNVPKREWQRMTSLTDNLRSPAMAGGLFAMDRKFFFELGGYDEGMNIWGGENVEISLRIWRCGGTLEFIPCSRVGHMYRHQFPYKTDNKDLSLNLKRVAEVWLDDYKRIFYLNRPDLKEKDAGDLTSRLKLKEDLKCKSFKWFLDNVFPELFVFDENVLAYGSICTSSPSKNPLLTTSLKICWDTMGLHDSLGSYIVKAFPYQGNNSFTQIFSLDLKERIRKDNKCLAAHKLNEESNLQMDSCDGKNILKVLHDQITNQLKVKYAKDEKNINNNNNNNNNNNININNNNNNNHNDADDDGERCIELDDREAAKNKYNLLLRNCQPQSQKQTWEFLI